MGEKIIVIGAGASGLIAAKSLVKNGYEVTVIEARNRIGGRIHTTEGKFSRPVETGAEFMHGKQPLTGSLAEASGARTTLLSGNRYQLWNGKLERAGFFDDQWNLLTKALGELTSDTDIATFLHEHFRGEKYSNLRKRVKGFVEGYDAADLDRVSAMALKEEWAQTDDAHQYRITGGYMRLMRYLEKEVGTQGGKLLLSSPVTEVDWSPGNVKIKMGSGNTLEGEKAIITVPLGVLQRKGLRFSPPLREHETVFGHIGFGGVIKIILEFGHPFWEDTTTRRLEEPAFIFSDADIPTWWSQLPDTVPLLTGWLGGPATFEISHEQESILEKALRSMEYIFSVPAAEIKRHLREWQAVNWATEPFTFGAYAYPIKGKAPAKKFISTPVRETLYFAGEAFYEGTAIGTVEAALVSGQTVAEKIIRTKGRSPIHS